MPANEKSFEAVGTDALSYGNVSISTAAIVRATNRTRVSVALRPIDGDVYLGKDSNVTTSTGFLIRQGDVFTDNEYIGDIYAIASSGTVNIRYWEVG